jgi:hypothetical protein
MPKCNSVKVLRQSRQFYEFEVCTFLHTLKNSKPKRKKNYASLKIYFVVQRLCSKPQYCQTQQQFILMKRKLSYEPRTFWWCHIWQRIYSQHTKNCSLVSKTNDQLQNGAKDLNRHFSKKDRQVGKKHTWKPWWDTAHPLEGLEFLKVDSCSIWRMWNNWYSPDCWKYEKCYNCFGNESVLP